MPTTRNKRKTVRTIGILTSGGDCPGLNAAIRGVAKAAMHEHGMRVIGFQDGFRGLVENRCIPLEDATVSGILTQGGTILGSVRDKLAKMRIGDQVLDMAQVAAENLQRNHVDCLVCLGGGGTQKNALHLIEKTGFPVITLPKTIDNDVVETDTTFGFDSALGIATEAIDRLHTTATSHHRIIVCEIMGHNAGWLALGAGIAGGADVILIPEIPYDLDKVGEFLVERRTHGKRFSIIALAEGAASAADVERLAHESERKDKAIRKGAKAPKPTEGEGPHMVEEPKASRLARELQRLTGTEARVTTLGHVQRGGIPSPADRLLCTLLGSRAAELAAERHFNVLVAVRGRDTEPVPIEDVAGKVKRVPEDHEWIRAARRMQTAFGD